ncbi:tetratricopeptide repeat protein [candidate division KSB1 bacterium]|nr:tetratricopeptide repeat protein [candidate division KSB1 bacterium]
MRVILSLLTIFAFLTIAHAETVAEFLATGDAAYDALDNEAALQAFQAAFAADEGSCEAAWKVSRSFADIGDEKQGKEERIEYFNKAEEYARKAIAICPNSDMAHLYLSVAIGRVALMAGKKEQVQLSKSVKEEAEKAIELNPDNDTAHHVYARWHRKVATLSEVQKVFAKVLYGGLPPASLEKAVEHFNEAIALNPTNINHHLELGLTYEEMKAWDKAEAEYQTVASLPPLKSMDPKYKAEAAERQKEIAKKL